MVELTGIQQEQQRLAEFIFGTPQWANAEPLQTLLLEQSQLREQAELVSWARTLLLATQHGARDAATDPSQSPMGAPRNHVARDHATDYLHYEY